MRKLSLMPKNVYCFVVCIAMINVHECNILFNTVYIYHIRA